MTNQVPVTLTPGIADTNEYGNNFNGNSDEDGIISFAFLATEGDLELTLSGYDVDFNDEVEVLLNGASIGFLTSGPNNALKDQNFLIAAADMQEGENTISFVQTLDATFAWGVTNVLLEAAEAVEEETPTDVPVADLTLGEVNTGKYGQRFDDARDEDGLVSYTFQGTGEDLVLSFDGYDLDSDGEMELYLNGVLVGPVDAGTNDGLSGHSYELAAADLLVGENTITFKQANDVAYKWGVTNVKIDTPVDEEIATDIPVADLTLGVVNSDKYGQRFDDARDADGLVSYTFQGTGEDLVLSFDGYDLDSDGEMEVYLNGALVGPVSAGVDNGLSSNSIEFAAADLQLGENIVTFKQANNVAYMWGVTNVKIDTPAAEEEEEIPTDIPVADLARGIADTGIYGQRFEDARDEDGLVSYTFEGTGEDLVLSFDGYDLDSDGEMELYLNGVLVGPVSAGTNNGLSSKSYELAAADLLVGENTVTFKQANNVAYMWGVTNVKIDTPAPEEEIPTDIPVAFLSLGVANTEKFGHRYDGVKDSDGLVSYTFDSFGTDLVLSFDGYDLDSDGEMEVYLNGALVGPVSAGVDNGLSSNSIEFAAADLLFGENTVTFKQANNVAYVWGVTNVEIDFPEPEVEVPTDIPVAHLNLGITESGSHGHRFNGVKDTDGQVSFTFDATGNDMAIDLDGFDIDSDGEVEVYLNDTLVGELSSGPNNGFIAHRFEFASEDLLSGENVVTFKQANDVLYVWGVTNLTLSEVPNTVGTSGDDRIVGGQGNDILTGDSGNDVFVFFAGGAQDVIADFALADDMIELQNFGLSQFSQLDIDNDAGSNAVLTFNGTDTLTLNGIDAAQLTESHFDFV